jgi:hypothetical protein
MALVMIKRGIPRKLHNEIEIKIHKDIGWTKNQKQAFYLTMNH